MSKLTQKAKQIAPKEKTVKVQESQEVKETVKVQKGAKAQDLSEKQLLLKAMQNGGVTSEQAIKIMHPNSDLSDKEVKQAAGRSVRRVLRSLVKQYNGRIVSEGRTKIYSISVQ